jgi:hypothetical protein
MELCARGIMTDEDGIIIAEISRAARARYNQKQAENN